MNAIKNITVGHTERLRKPVGYTAGYESSLDDFCYIGRVYGGDGFCRTRRLSCKLSRCL